MHTGRSTAPLYHFCHSISIFLRLQFLIFFFKSFRVSAFISNTPLMFLLLIIHCVRLPTTFLKTFCNVIINHMIPNTIHKIKLAKKKFSEKSRAIDDKDLVILIEIRIRMY